MTTQKISKVDLMKVGALVHDSSFGMNGVIIDNDWIEPARPHSRPSRPAANWEWLVLYEDGILSGANTMYLQAVL